MLRNDIKQVICSFASELDFYFEERGFKRRKNGLMKFLADKNSVVLVLEP